VLAARSEKELDRVGGDVKKANPNTRVLKVRTDVTDEASVENLFKEAHKEFNDLDVEHQHQSLLILQVLINNAGSLNSEKIANSKVGDWWLNWTVNIKVAPSRMTF
jgi:NADP-dependent 3-hydroxy acid dehydrogenase YdfG